CAGHVALVAGSGQRGLELVIRGVVRQGVDAAFGVGKVGLLRVVARAAYCGAGSMLPVAANLPALLSFTDRGTKCTFPAADLHVRFKPQVFAEVQALSELGGTDGGKLGRTDPSRGEVRANGRGLRGHAA